MNEIKIGKYTLRHGMRVSCTIGSKKCSGKISLDGIDSPYICQDVSAGSNIQDKLGYKYSWSLSGGMSVNYVTEFKILYNIDDYDVY